MRKAIILAVLMSACAVSARAQQAPIRLSGPNTPVPSPICDLVNFGFCPQPAPPPPDLPDPNMVDQAPPVQPAVRHGRVHRRQ